MKKLCFLILIFSFLISSYGQVLPIVESGQRIIQITAGVNPTYYNFDVSHIDMAYDDFFCIKCYKKYLTFGKLNFENFNQINKIIIH